MTVQEVFCQFKVEFPTVNIGKSKFASLRPQHVMLCHETPHNVCVCAVHFNFISVINTLSVKLPGVGGPYSEMWSVNAVCTPRSEQCFFNECD
jgi:hypothetical protein